MTTQKLKVCGLALLWMASWAQGKEWKEVQCLPKIPFTFCILELGCDSGGFNIRFSPDGRLLATVSDPPNNVIRIWDLHTAQLVRAFRAPEMWMFVQIEFSPDGKLLAATLFPVKQTTGLFPRVKVWEVATGQEVHALSVHADWIAFSPDGKWLATCSTDEEMVELWDIASGQKAYTFVANAPTFIAFNPTKNLLVINENYARVRLLDIEAKEDVYTLKGDPDFRGPIAFSRDGSLLATGSSDGTIKLWDMVTGQEVHTFLGHSGVVLSVTFCPNGRVLASSAKDHTVRFWDVASGQEIYVLDLWNLFELGKGYPEELLAHVDRVTSISVAFSPTEPILATGIRTVNPEDERCPCRGMVHLWNVAELLEK